MFVDQPKYGAGVGAASCYRPGWYTMGGAGVTDKGSGQSVFARRVRYCVRFAKDDPRRFRATWRPVAG